MSFRDDFYGARLIPVGPRQRSFAEWSLEGTMDSGFRTNHRHLVALGHEVKQAFENSIECLTNSQEETAAILRKEIAHQAREIIDALGRQSSEIVSALQDACDYLGGELCEIKWAIERQTKISSQILQVLLNSLHNTSRQYYEQGVRCYENNENGFARERFNLALEANRTNYFAYQYLGFIAAKEDNSKSALSNFGLATKFAETSYHRALAFSHLARSYHAIGDFHKAVECARRATDLDPSSPNLWYELAKYSVRINNPSNAMAALQRAIHGDWTYWSICTSDASFSSIRGAVADLLGQIREKTRRAAERELELLKTAIHMVTGMKPLPEIVVVVQALRSCELKLRQATVFALREVVVEAALARRQLFELTQVAVERKIRETRGSIELAKRKQVALVEEADSLVRSLEQEHTNIVTGFKPYGGTGFIVAVLAFQVMFSFQILTNPKDLKTLGLEGRALAINFAWVAFWVIILIILLRNPVKRLIEVTLPIERLATKINDERSRADAKKRRLSSDLAQLLTSYDAELRQLTIYQNMCASEISAMPTPQ